MSKLGHFETWGWDFKLPEFLSRSASLKVAKVGRLCFRKSSSPGHLSCSGNAAFHPKTQPWEEEEEEAPRSHPPLNVKTRPGMSYPALPSIYRLLVKALPYFEADLRGTDGGGGLDVELVPVLADLHVGLRGGGHGHFPQHGVHSWVDTGGRAGC